MPSSELRAPRLDEDGPAEAEERDFGEDILESDMEEQRNVVSVTRCGFRYLFEHVFATFWLLSQLYVRSVFVNL